MHILVIPSWYSNPRNPVLGSFFKEQALALQKFGHKITIAYNEIWPLTLIGKIHEKKGISFNIEEGLNTYRYKNYNYLPKNPLMFRIFNRRMEKLLKHIINKEGKPDLIHAHSAFWGGISAAYISEKYNIPLVLTEHSSLKHSRYMKYSYVPHISYAYNKADCIIAVGNSLKEELKNYTSNNRIKVIPNMVNLDKFLDTNSSTNSSSEFVFFSLAFLEPGKGMDTLIKAFGKALNKEQNMKLFIGGTGSEIEYLRNLIISLDLQDKIELLGALSREKVAEYMNKCDCFALASESETFGVVYIEALAAGKPIIGTKNGGAEDIIKPFNGLLTEIGDIHQLSDSMIYIKENYHKYDKKHIKEQCIREYSPRNIVDKINNVYEEIL